MKQVVLKRFLKKYREVAMTIASSKMELLALVNGFEPLTYLTKNSISGVIGSPKPTYGVPKHILKFVHVIKAVHKLKKPTP